MKRLRTLAASIAMIAVLSATIACSTSWVAQAEAIVAALTPAVVNILQLTLLLQNKTISAADSAIIQKVTSEVNADLTLVGALIDQYNNAAAADKPGLLAKIETVTATIDSNLNSLLPSLHITDQVTAAKITAVVGIVISEVQSLQALIPLVKSNAKKLPNGSLDVPLSAHQFKKSFNAIMTAPTGNVRVDNATKKLAIN